MKQYLDNFIHTSRHNDWIAGVWREPHTGHPTSMPFILFTTTARKLNAHFHPLLRSRGTFLIRDTWVISMYKADTVYQHKTMYHIEVFTLLQLYCNTFLNLHLSCQQNMCVILYGRLTTIEKFKSPGLRVVATLMIWLVFWKSSCLGEVVNMEVWLHMKWQSSVLFWNFMKRSSEIS